MIRDPEYEMIYVIVCVLSSVPLSWIFFLSMMVFLVVLSHLITFLLLISDLLNCITSSIHSYTNESTLHDSTGLTTVQTHSSSTSKDNEVACLTSDLSFPFNWNRKTYSFQCFQYTFFFISQFTLIFQMTNPFFSVTH